VEIVYGWGDSGAGSMTMKRSTLRDPNFVRQSVQTLLDKHTKSFSQWVEKTENRQREVYNTKDEGTSNNRSGSGVDKKSD
jgi:hypothetical protein